MGMRKIGQKFCESLRQDRIEKEQYEKVPVHYIARPVMRQDDIEDEDYIPEHIAKKDLQKFNKDTFLAGFKTYLEDDMEK